VIGLVVSPDLRARLEIGASIVAPEARFDDFFPSRVAAQGITAVPNEEQRLRSRLGRGYVPSRAQTLEVPKWSGGTRPVVDLTIQDRVVYHSVVSLIRSAIPDGIVNWTPSPEERVAREREIAAGDWEYVLRADVTAYYEYVSHALLEEELIDLTAEDEAVDLLIALLGHTQGRATGLPQGPKASGILADTYLSVVDRALARQGVTFLRFSDDYRVPTRSWREALRKQSNLERLLRERGLTLNSGKTRVPTRTKYADWLDELSVPARHARDTTSTEYGGPPRPADASTRALRRAAEAVVADVAESPDYWGDSYEQSRRLVDAIRVLAPAKSRNPLEHFPGLYQSFPHLTKELTRYVRAQMGSGTETAALRAVATSVLDERYLFDWQLGWLFHAVPPAELNLPSKLMDAALSALEDPLLPWFARGRAAVLLSTEERLPLGQDYFAIFEEAPDATKPDLLAAVVNMPESKDRTAFVASTATTPVLRPLREFLETAAIQQL
jgi:hypothetical protein